MITIFENMEPEILKICSVFFFCLFVFFKQKLNEVAVLAFTSHNRKHIYYENMPMQF